MHEIQRAYEQIRGHFSRPGAVLGRASDGNGGCVYFNPDNGAKCAVGALLPAEWIEQRGVGNVNMTGSIGGLLEIYPEARGFVGLYGSQLFEFLSGAQSLHDSSSNTEEFVQRLDWLASDSGLAVVSVEVEAPAAEHVLVTA